MAKGTVINPNKVCLLEGSSFWWVNLTARVHIS